MWSCPIASEQGLLVCPTVAGCVVAVDLLTRTRSWAYRYEREDVQPANELLGARPGIQGLALREGWHAVAVALADGLAVIASPESHAARCTCWIWQAGNCGGRGNVRTDCIWPVFSWPDRDCGKDGIAPESSTPPKNRVWRA